MMIFVRYKQIYKWFLPSKVVIGRVGVVGRDNLILLICFFVFFCFIFVIVFVLNRMANFSRLFLSLLSLCCLEANSKYCLFLFLNSFFEIDHSSRPYIDGGVCPASVCSDK